MIIVAGYLTVKPTDRDTYLDGCVDVVRLARAADGCLDFSIAPDLLEPGRINVYERWSDAVTLAAFRGSGPDADQQAQMVSADVGEYDASTR